MSNQSEEQELASMYREQPVTQQFSKEQLRERAKEFMRVNCGSVRDMAPADQRAYHQNHGLLMLYIDWVWKPFS